MKTGSCAAFPFTFCLCLKAQLQEVHEGSFFPGDFQPHFSDVKSSSVWVNVKRSKQLSDSLSETPDPLLLSSFTSQPVWGRGAKMQKRSPEVLLPSTSFHSWISVAASHSYMGDLVCQGVSAGRVFPYVQVSGESFETSKPCWRWCSGLGAWVNSQLLIQVRVLLLSQCCWALGDTLGMLGRCLAETAHLCSAHLCHVHFPVSQPKVERMKKAANCSPKPGENPVVSKH